MNFDNWRSVHFLKPNILQVRSLGVTNKQNSSKTEKQKMGSYQAPRKWQPELDSINTALNIQNRQKHERIKLLNQGLLYDWQQQTMTPELYQEEMEAIKQEYITNYHKARQPNPDLPIITRTFAEHRTNKQKFPPIIDQPTPTLLSTQ